MGVENNECVIATTWSDERVADVRKWIATIGGYGQLFVFVSSLVNGKTTILMAPDGSKKGWGIAGECEQLREKFVALLESFNNVDGSNPFDWVEVGYGEFGQKVLRGNNMNCYNEKPYATDEE